MKRNNKKIMRACTVSMSVEFFKEIMKRMRDEGYKMEAVTSPGTELDKLKDDGFLCFGIPMERHISPIRDLVSLFRLTALFMREKPYVVHSITPKAGLLCMMAAYITRVPIRIHTFTGLVWPTSKGISRRIIMFTDWLTCRCATHVIPEGQGVLNDLKNGGITRKPMKVLGYGNVRGIDLNRFDPKRFEKAYDNNHIFTYLYVGRIVGDKGINELVEAFTQLYQANTKTRLILVGKYEEHLDPIKEQTKRTIAEHPAITSPGGKYGDDLLSEYANADCLVMPSYREGFPNTVLEAGAMGLPSIVTDINGSREIIVDGENGIIIPSHDATALYNAMKRMYEDHNLRNNMKGKARTMIASRFEKTFVQDCQISFYKEIMGI